MKKLRLIIACLWPAFFLITPGCNSGSEKKMNERVTFWSKDKNPYGAWYAHEQLDYVFPEAVIIDEKSSPAFQGGNAYSSLQQLVAVQQEDSGKALLVILAQNVTPDSNEIAALKNFVSSGNFVFISALHFGDELCSALQIKLALEKSADFKIDSMRLDILNPESGQPESFVYPGFGMHAYFEKFDSLHTQVIGRNAHGLPTLLVSGDSASGQFLLHSMPFALSNFFLLHKQNKVFYDELFSYLPANINIVVWDEYFRSPVHNRDFAALKVIMDNNSLRLTLFLFLLGLGLLLFSELKRRQRIIPVLEPVTNSAVDFVKTIGRLYFQVRDNDDLAAKMVAHFKDYVRSRYALDCSWLDENFVHSLSYKSGIEKVEIAMMVECIYRIEMGNLVSENDLLKLHEQLDKFYKN